MGYLSVHEIVRKNQKKASVKMKEYIILIMVLVLIFVPNYFIRNYLKSSGDEIVVYIKNMQESLENNKEIGKNYAYGLKQMFLEKEKIWIILVDHDMLDEIENDIEECVAFFSIDEVADFNASSLKAIDAIEDLSKREELSLANIF